MKVYTRGVIDLRTGEVLEATVEEYSGPVALAGGSGKDSTTNTTSEPPSWQTPYIRDVLAQAQQNFNAGPAEYFPGSTVAPMNPQMQTGLNSMFGAADQQQQIADASSGALQFQLGAGADPRTNPYFQAVQDAIVRNSGKGLTETALPAIDSGAVVAGGFGGSRQGVAQGSAIDNYSKNMIDRLATFGSDAYNKGQDTQSRALALSTGVQGQQAAPGQTQAAVGTALQGFEQAQLDDLVARFNFGQYADDQNLNTYAGLVGNPMGTSGTTNVEAGGTSPWMRALGGAAIGGGAGTAIAGSFAPISIAGAGLGAMLGLF